MDKSKKTYIGLTVGPIFESIANAKETGELWASSYLFSYIMKNIIKKLIEKDIKLKNKFIVPYVDDKNIFYEPHEVGLFNDRFIFESKDGDFELVEKSVQEVKDDIIKDIKSYNNNEGNEKVKQNIDDFLKIYYLEVDIDTDGKEEYNNIIFKVNKCLDALELRENIPNEDGMKENYLLATLNNKKLKEKNFKYHFLSKDAYGDIGKEGDYPSLFKIALGKTNENEFPNEDKEIKKRLEDDMKDGVLNNLIKADEYVAIVQADGDSISKVIKKLKIREDKKDIYKEYKNFSKKLLDYSKDSSETIKKYGGFTVYAGGDDLLFIAPILNDKNRIKFERKNDNGELIKEEYFDSNIFGLIDCLSRVFEDKFEGDKFKPTVSFGVAMVHHKYPLYYALDEARELLFDIAKKYKFKENEKNAIAFKVIKNSGQSFETVIGKNSISYKEFKLLFKKVIINEDKSKTTKNYLKAIHFKLIKDKIILNKIGTDKKLLKNYFENNFNEEIHKTESIKNYIKNLIDFIYKIYNENECKSIEQIFTYLRFIKFMDEDIILQKKKVKK